MTTLRILRGIPGSGKTTHAMEWLNEAPRRFRSNRDDMRINLFGQYVLPKEDEKRITAIQYGEIELHLKAGLDVIVDDTNLRAATVRDLLKIAGKAGAEVEHRDFPIDVDEAVRRNAERGAKGERSVPEAIVRDFYKRYMDKGKFPAFPVISEILREISPVEYISGLPEAYLVDIDGTVAHGYFEELSENHTDGRRRKPFEWSRVGEDDPALNVIQTINSLREAGAIIIFMSARKDICFEETYDWIYTHFGWKPEHLYMRRTDDDRPDDETKSEMFDTHIRGKFNIIACFDDRDKVVRQYRDMGLTVYQVAYGDF